MTNKPMLSVERELLEELQWHYKPYDDHYHKESGYYCPMCGSEKSQGHEAKCEIKAVFDKPAAQHQGEAFTYSSKQATNCAGCGLRKHTPLRVDNMGGYVCLTCIDNRLGELLGAERRQVEPVAIVDESDDGLFIEFVYGEDGNPLKRGDKLYTDQPAPVAVDAEILERFPEINFANYGQDEVEALQAWAFEAHEAIARLNGMKP